MEHLKTAERFTTYKKGENLSVYVTKLVTWIERSIFSRVSRRINWLLEHIGSSGDSFEIYPPGNGPGDDGNWRHRADAGGDLIWEKKISGTWIDMNRIYG